MQQKTIFLNFYQTKDYFFWLDNKNKRFLRTIYLFLRNSRSMPPDVFLKNDKHLFRRTPLGDCFWNIWKCSPLLFCYFTIFPEAVPQRNSRSSLPDVFLKKDTAYIMSDYGFSLTHIFPYKDKIYDSDLIQQNTENRNPNSVIFFAVG